ncbi:DUF433 domain-containing protein [Candidatus Roizmanbacteria bacterium]|nr:DUF433 domain-containing protein [Candidatus Roizmanbacteria bacterium]
MIQKQKIDEIISKDSDVLGGKAVFKGTRVPVTLVLKYISNGLSISQIKQAFPTVKTNHISKLITILSEEFNLDEKNKKGHYSMG